MIRDLGNKLIQWVCVFGGLGFSTSSKIHMMMKKIYQDSKIFSSLKKFKNCHEQHYSFIMKKIQNSKKKKFITHLLNKSFEIKNLI
jgi:hypothetical protein